MATPKNDQVVATVTRKKPATRARKLKVSWPCVDGRTYQIVYDRNALYVPVKRKQHRLLNMHPPTTPAGALVAPPEDLVCPRCKYAYSHQVDRRGVCNECELEAQADKARQLENAGVELGWRPVPTYFERSTPSA